MGIEAQGTTSSSYELASVSDYITQGTTQVILWNLISLVVIATYLYVLQSLASHCELLEMLQEGHDIRVANHSKVMHLEEHISSLNRQLSESLAFTKELLKKVGLH